MTRIFTVMTLATLFTTTAMAAAGPDIREPAKVCDSANFANQGQWIQCLHEEGIRGRELARAIHDEHQARKGGETTERTKRRSKAMAKRAEHRFGEGRGRNQ